MANPFLGVRIPPELHEAIANRMQATGQSKSEIAIEALKLYLGVSPPPDRLNRLEQRISALELEFRLLSLECRAIRKIANLESGAHCHLREDTDSH
jgi:hypothetical protein